MRALHKKSAAQAEAAGRARTKEQPLCPGQLTDQAGQKRHSSGGKEACHHAGGAVEPWSQRGRESHSVIRAAGRRGSLNGHCK